SDRGPGPPLSAGRGVPAAPGVLRTAPGSGGGGERGRLRGAAGLPREAQAGVEDALTMKSLGEQPFGALTPLLAPRSVAVIGASDRAGNLGGLAVGFLQKFGFRGPVWPVNAGRSSVAGVPCFPDLGALPETPDLAILAVPAGSVVDVARDCIAAGVPSAIVWAGGFAEGDEDGRARQRELTE